MIDRRCAVARSRATRSSLAVALIACSIAGSQVARSDDFNNQISSGNLLVSRSVYDNNPNNVVAGVTLLPPNCVGSACATANAGGTYPEVFNNDLVGGSFGITSKVVLDQRTTSGSLINSIEVLAARHRAKLGSDSHELFIEIGARAQLVDRPQHLDLHGLPRTG